MNEYELEVEVEKEYDEMMEAQEAYHNECDAYLMEYMSEFYDYR